MPGWATASTSKPVPSLPLPTKGRRRPTVESVYLAIMAAERRRRGRVRTGLLWGVAFKSKDGRFLIQLDHGEFSIHQIQTNTLVATARTVAEVETRIRELGGAPTLADLIED